MEPYLYQIKLHPHDNSKHSEFEFTVVGNNLDRRDTEAQRIGEWFRENSNPVAESFTLAKPMNVNDFLVTEHNEYQIDWNEAQKRVENQRNTRPRGTGCVFRGSSPERNEAMPYSDGELVELQESIEYFMDDHRVAGESYLFVGSLWRKDKRLRYGEICIFEASGIQLAADLVQIRFLSEFPRITLTEWCGPISVI